MALCFSSLFYITVHDLKIPLGEGHDRALSRYRNRVVEVGKGVRTRLRDFPYPLVALCYFLLTAVDSGHSPRFPAKRLFRFVPEYGDERQDKHHEPL